jgi:Protein of unknown function (DUF3293)
MAAGKLPVSFDLLLIQVFLVCFFSVSSIEIDPDHWIHVSIDSTVEGPGGSLRLVPEVFRSGVVYGISACHPQGQQSDDGFNRAKNAELLQELQDMWPQPSAIWRRVSQTPPIASASTSTPTFWKDDGFAVAFDTASVEAERGLLFLARSFGQAAVYKWWPHIWSFHPVDDATLMQGVVPVASGLSHMRYELPAYVVDGATTQLLPDAHTAPDRDEL